MLTPNKPGSCAEWGIVVSLLTTTLVLLHGRMDGQEPSSAPVIAADAEIEVAFQQQIQPLIRTYCVDCHNADDMQSGIRVDRLTSTPEDRELFLWKAILKQVADGAMPPKDERQLTEKERRTLTDWIPSAMTAAMSRNTQKNGSARRLTVAQYRNSLKDLLGLNEDLTEALPPDGVSKDGFTNNGQLMALSPLQVEAYFDIAEKALDLCIVDETVPPAIQNFRMDLGAGINPEPCPDTLILGALNALLKNDEFVVTELTPEKPFAFQPFRMRKEYDFIEGYAGNDTVRGWRKFDSIYHSVFACMRGTPGYPKGDPYQLVPRGLLLRPAIPSSEIFGQSNTYGPMANFKISLRELPGHGDLRVTVTAARYEDGLLIDAGTPAQSMIEGQSFSAADLAAETKVKIADAGIYQIDVVFTKGDAPGTLSLNLGGRWFTGNLLTPKPVTPGDDNSDQVSAFLLVRLPAETLPLSARCGDNSRLRRLLFHHLPEDSELAKRFQNFEKRSPSVGVHVGLRRDCGSTLTQVGEPAVVSSGELRTYVFEGPINDFPSPDVEPNNVNYLAGVREIGVRSEYTDGRDMPRLLIRSIEFEGPYYDSWPPQTHRNIFIESPQRENPTVYAHEIISSFATRAFRRPVTETEAAGYFAVWKAAYAERQDFRQSIKEALLVILTSPQFLFLIENSLSPDPEDLDDYELASKLSYFLWNTAPDRQLLELAAQGELRAALDAEFARMVADPRFGQFVREFAAQWLSLDKFDVVAVDARRYPKLTRDVKTQLRQEPAHYLHYLLQHNLPMRNLVQSDFLLANEVVANYYGLGDRANSGFAFVPIRHDNEHLGGVLTQAGILAGLSDGREANPVKRGAWLARKIIADPPDDPPPNVPKLPEDDGAHLTLRQKLERHRHQEGCVKCHRGIDPWGLPFEAYDAGGLFRQDAAVDARSKLPDGTDVEDLKGLKRYLADDRLDQVAFSFLKHAAIYATGRSLTYNELVFLQNESVKFKSRDEGLQDLLRFLIHSDLFLKK